MCNRQLTRPMAPPFAKVSSTSRKYRRYLTILDADALPRRTSTNEMSSPLSPRQDTLAPPAVAQQQHAFEACLRQVNVQSRELITAISNLEIILNAALDAAVTDTDLASIGFEPHDLPDGFRVYFRNVDQRGQGSGAEQSFGGPFLREEAVAEFRAEMARRQS